MFSYSSVTTGEKPIYLLVIATHDPDGSYVDTEEYDSEIEAQRRMLKLCAEPDPLPRYAGFYSCEVTLYTAFKMNSDHYKVTIR